MGKTQETFNKKEKEKKAFKKTSGQTSKNRDASR